MLSLAHSFGRNECREGHFIGYFGGLNAMCAIELCIYCLSREQIRRKTERRDTHSARTRIQHMLFSVRTCKLIAFQTEYDNNDRTEKQFFFLRCSVCFCFHLLSSLSFSPRFIFNL